jgi:hypothetical protein
MVTMISSRTGFYTSGPRVVARARFNSCATLRHLAVPAWHAFFWGQGAEGNNPSGRVDRATDARLIHYRCPLSARLDAPTPLPLPGPAALLIGGGCLCWCRSRHRPPCGRPWGTGEDRRRRSPGPYPPDRP